MTMAKATERYRSRQTLTPRQEAAVALLAIGRTIAEVADTVSVHRITLTNWLNHSQLFQDALRSRRLELWATGLDLHRAVLLKALRKIDDALDAEGADAKTALAFLRLVAPLGSPEVTPFAEGTHRSALPDDPRRHAAHAPVPRDLTIAEFMRANPSKVGPMIVLLEELGDLMES